MGERSLADLSRAQNRDSGLLLQQFYSKSKTSPYTGRTPDQSIELGFRTFTLYSEPCKGLPITEKVVVEPARITLQVGERYFLPDIASSLP
jgi:hypothetical protein